MRKVSITLISLCLLCLTASLPAAEIFSAAIPFGESVSLPPVNPGLVLRQRAVRIDLDEVSANLDDGLHLDFNLFEDATFEVYCDGLNDGPDGSQICYGTVVGAPPGQATMVMGETSLAATLITAERTYKVRPIDDNWHVVRDIRPEKGGDTLWAAAATDDERTVWTLTNQERAENGLHGLSLNSELTAAARAHSADMATQNYFSHDSLDTRSPGDRVAAAGYERYTGENIAAGYATPEAVILGWMNSPGHRDNILSSNHCDLGVGYAYDEDSHYKTYWTQDFGRQPGVSECPAVSDDSGGDGDDSGGDGDDNGGDSGSTSGSEGGGCFIGVTDSFQ